MNKPLIPIWQVALLTIALSSGCAINPVTGKQDFVLMSEAQEIKLGQRYHQKILKEYKTYDNPALQAYVRQVAAPIAANSHRTELGFHFTVLDSEEVNAFALPGGYIYITRGIMAYLNSEAELAGVIGHEIGHVTARHSVRQHSQATVTGILGSVLSAAVGGGEQVFNTLGTALVRGYGRDHELEADRLGAEYLARNGYDPQEMIKVVGVLKDQETFAKAQAEQEGREASSYHGLFATHPRNDDRLKTVVNAANKLKAGNRDANRELYLRHIDGMTFGSNASEGVVRGTHFYHQKLNFTLQAPPGWIINNFPDRLTLQQTDSKALIQMSLQSVAPGSAPLNVLREAAGSHKLSGFTELSSNEFKGAMATSPGDTPFGRGTVHRAAWLRNDQAFVFAGATNQSAQQDFAAKYREVINSFRELQNNEQQLAKPLHIEVIVAEPGDSYESLAKRYPLESNTADRLRLINGQYPQGQPTAGQPIKIIR